jgi:RNA polymerase sigma factor (sigma-70 family)
MTLDADQVRAAIAGRPQAIDRVVEASLPRVLAWCRRLGGPRVDAEDAAHEAMLVVIDRIGTLRDPDGFAAWLFQVTRRVLAAHRRRAWFARWVPGLAVDPRDPSPDPEGRAMLGETSEAVRRLLEALPAIHREVLVLCDVEGCTDDEAAALLGVAVGTAKSRLRVARERFRGAAAAEGLGFDAPAVPSILRETG